MAKVSVESESSREHDGSRVLKYIRHEERLMVKRSLAGRVGVVSIWQILFHALILTFGRKSSAYAVGT